MKAIIFDCWGTLFYVRKHPYASLMRALGKVAQGEANRGKHFALFEKHLMSTSDETHIRIRRFLDALAIQKNDNTVQQLCDTIHPVRYFAFKDTFPALRLLKKKYKLGLLTNTTKESFERLRKKYKIEHVFDVVVASYEVKLVKPNQKIFKVMLDKLDVSAAEAVMVGDSVVDDFTGARSAGLSPILLDRRNRHPHIKQRVKSLLKLPKYLQS